MPSAPANPSLSRPAARHCPHLTSLLLLALLLAGNATAQQEPTANSAANDTSLLETVPELSPEQQTIQRLVDIRTVVSAKNLELEKLRKELKRATSEEERRDIEAQIEQIPRTLDKMKQAFEQLAIGGIDISKLKDDQQQEFNWKLELEQITQPVLAGLRELTEKPRRIEQLRGEIQTYEKRIDIVARALESLDELLKADPPDKVRDRLKQLREDWAQREVNLNGQLDVARVQLASLSGENLSLWQSIRIHSMDFMQGRGLTLLLALIVGIGLWTLTRKLIQLAERMTHRHFEDTEREQVRWERLTVYAYRTASVIVVVIGLLSVFYARGDLLLFGLGLLLMLAIAITTRSALPRYIDEIRLLLDLGSVRSGERILYEGIPMQVRRMGAYATLVNPELEGTVQLPIDRLGEFVSRPSRNEPWYPTKPNEYVFLEDDRFGQVLRQTVEFVDVKMVGSTVRFSSADFLNLHPRNLSRRQFALPITFGVDYQHQAICLDQIPQALREGLTRELEQREFLDLVDDMTIEFSEAAANSLDYLVVLTLRGDAAGSYFSIKRCMQQACVRVCNEHGWVIPFAQLTIHAGEGMGRPQPA